MCPIGIFSISHLICVCRSFDCLRIGDKGVKIVTPEDGGGIKPGVDADIDAGYDPIDDYDENVG